MFVPNQHIINKGEMFHELYLIFQGSVILSLHEKNVSEYFRLYSSNYFGDF